jgi:hypothetical protein
MYGVVIFGHVCREDLFLNLKEFLKYGTPSPNISAARQGQVCIIYSYAITSLVRKDSVQDKRRVENSAPHTYISFVCVTIAAASPNLGFTINSKGTGHLYHITSFISKEGRQPLTS